LSYIPRLPRIIPYLISVINLALALDAFNPVTQLARRHGYLHGLALTATGKRLAQGGGAGNFTLGGVHLPGTDYDIAQLFPGSQVTQDKAIPDICLEG